MANKMKVEELRTQLQQRGLSTTGIKPTLIRRLEAAIREENKQLTTDDGVAARRSGRKRTRDSDNVDSDQPDETSDQLVQNVKDEEAVSCKEEPEKKIVTTTKKGAAVLDPWLPDDIKRQYHVLQLGDEIYEAMLNQTNVGDNNNKFFVIQVLEFDGGGKFLVYNRWGRVGIKGQDNINGPYASRERAIREFEQKFLAKTKNAWSHRNNFVCYPKCYAWLEMDYSGKEEESTVVTENPGNALRKQPLESKLEPRVAKFVSLVCNVSMMIQQMMEIGYNANKLPLGKLSKSTILKGYQVLKRIADVIDKSDRKALEQLSGEFYTVIPHDFGFKNMRDFVIDTPQKLKHKLEMVEALGEIEVASKLLKDDGEMQEDPLYAQYQRLHCELVPVEFGCDEFYMIEKYMKNTHAETHSNYTVEIVQIFNVSREGEAERFKKFSSTKNRMLLWHGSRLTNWTGILSQGLRIAPPEAPVTGYMFGKGVYFADMFSKSANYCYATHIKDGVLLLCEVALGEMAELLCANYDADKLPEGKLSTKGVGGTAPDFLEAQALEDGLVVPLGKPKSNSGTKGSLMYNEYIVYNVEQIRMRYVVHVKFNFNRRR
ncbi:putative NAD(+) ADP-ribosyltransferase transcription regulator SAP family [Lupinus albus]|uniref:Poly [ADP-ribose] polymerase n=1 Tax=Lupinus albus TaxID=3870 RepID=A0A6A4QDC3_LUPAL|nr:putative NAD(+) ADP-ribosyltransferase transcription regulator SAP family [Lupinus albus]